MNISDIQRMANDVEQLAIKLEDQYTAAGVDPLPPPGRLIVEAQCAWTLMALERALKERDDRAKAARQRATILGPGGRPL